MRRIVLLTLLFCFSANALAGTAGVQKLERELDEYQYAMTVEWDQKDQKFYETKTQEFFSSMEKIIREEGLANVEVLTLVQKKVVSEKTIEAIQLKLSLLSKSSSPEELARSLQTSAKDMYAQGASWNGEVTLYLGIGIVIIAAMAYKWWWEKNHVCTDWEERYDCSKSYWDNQNCTTYTDEDGFEHEDCDYYYRATETETCGMMNFCLNYEKI